MHMSAAIGNPDSVQSLCVAGARYRHLLDSARKFDPIRTAVVHPCTALAKLLVRRQRINQEAVKAL